MAFFLGYLNRLLPFATPGTPLIQDLIHLGVICGFLYFAPQIQEYIERQQDVQAVPEHPRGGDAEFEPEAADEEPTEPHMDARFNDQDQQANAGNGIDGEAFAEEPAAFGNPQADEDPPPGPANGRVPAQRNVGAKKAKALARRDQRRAYNEFQRSQGEAQRAKEAEGASEREKAQAAERERRKAVEAKLEEKKTKEREQRREQERQQREQEMRRREQAVELVREELDERQFSNMFEVAKQVGGDADDVWLEKILKAAGVLGKNADGSLTISTSLGWIVRVRREDMLRAYESAAKDGQHAKDGNISYEEFAIHLEKVLREGPQD